MDALRAVVRFAAEAAQEVLPLFESAHLGDGRPRDAVDAAWPFAEGARRTNLERTTTFAAHRPPRETTDECARHAARAAGDAAAAAYLHPLAKSSQAGHLLGAAAHAARAVELAAGDDPGVGDRHVEQTVWRATPVVAEVLRRYPPAPSGRAWLARLMRTLDADIRVSRGDPLH